MIDRYKLLEVDDYANAIKEIVQQIALLGLWRSKFYEKAAFYGGTALRILHNLNRFSEDLDFSLLEPDINFDLSKYNEAIQRELTSFGFKVAITNKTKSTVSNIKTSFIKLGTQEQLLSISAPAGMINSIHRDQTIKIKMEVDVNPPLHFNTQDRFLLHPIPFSVTAFDLPDLFASKIHAVLCRGWKNRVKGRDWFDMIWYVSQNVALSLSHLESRLMHNGSWPIEKTLTKQDVLELLFNKLESLDIEQTKQDVIVFISDKESLSVWSQTFFRHIINSIIFK